MQRASSTNTKPSATRIISNSYPATPASEPSSKRQKTDHTPESSAPTTPATEPRVYASRDDIKAALQAESAFEALARAKRADLGFGHNEYETEWVLNVPVPAVNGQTILDGNQDTDTSDSEDEGEEEQVTGRQTYGGYRRRKPNTTTTTSTTYSTPGSKYATPAKPSRYDDFDSDSTSNSDNDDNEDEDGEINSDSDVERKTPGSSSSNKKRKAALIDENDEDALSALDRTDLSKTGYAKAKKATTPSSGKQWGDHGVQKGKKGKWQGRGSRGKKLGRKG